MVSRCLLRLGLVVSLGFVGASVRAQPFQLPTANRALFEPGGEERYFVGTVGKPWTSGTFGGVRSEGGQLHEGLDIRGLKQDRKGEPIDPVLATADGTVAYINRKAGLSNYGNYVILRHLVEGLEIYSLYAHLSEVKAGLHAGQTVKAGDEIGVMGRTSNTAQRISKDRAHVHFELDLIVNDRFAAWFAQRCPGQRNDHGAWNGRNLAGLDPREILLAEHQAGARFSLLNYIRGQTVLCRVLVRDTKFPWVQRYAPLVRRNPLAEKEGIAGYELVLNYTGVICELTPRAPSEMKGPGKLCLLSVNEAEAAKNRCGHFVVKRTGTWQLTPKAVQWLDLVTF